MATELAKAYVQIVPSAEGIQGSIAKVLDGEASSAGESAGGKVGAGLGGAIKKALVGLGIGKIIADGITGTSEFETAMAKVGTLFSGTGEQFDALSAKILEMSSAFGLGATTLAEAAYSAESAGVPMESLGAMIEASAKLAVAGFTDIDTALSATAKTMNAYGMEGSDAISKVQNVLIQTQNLGITTVGELGAALANVTPTAAAAGVSFEQVGAALAQMTAAGVPTAQATTQLRSAMAELSKSGTKASDAFKAAAEGSKYAGMSFQDAVTSGMSLGDAFSMMQAYADASGVSMLDLWSSVEAGNAAMLIAGDVETFDKNLQAMADSADNVGAAYEKMANTFGTSMNKLKESAKNFMTTLFTGGDISASFDAMLDSLGDVGEKLTTWLTNALSGLGENLPNMMSSLLDFGAGLLESLAQVNWIDLGTTIINGIIGALGTLGTKLIELVGNAIKSVTSGDINFGEIGTAIWNGVTSVITTAGDWLKTLFDAAVTAITGGEGNMFGGIGEAILGGIHSFLDEGGKFLADLFGFGRDAASGEGMNYSSIGDAILNGVQNILDAGGQFLSKIFDAGISESKGLGWEDLGHAIKTAVDLALGAGDFLASIFRAGAKLVEGIQWGPVGEAIGSAVITGLNCASRLAEAFTSASEKLLSAVQWEQLGGDISNLVSTGIKGIDELMKVAFDAGVTLVKTIQWEQLGGDISNLVSNGLKGIDALMKSAFEAGVTLINTIGWSQLGTDITGLVSNGLEGLGSTMYSIFDAAKELIKGVKWGEVGQKIQEGLGDVWSGLTGFLGGVLGGAGETAEGIGSWIKAQLTGGNLKEVQDLQLALDALKKSLEESQESLKTAAQNIGACIRGGIEDELSSDKMNKIGADALTYIQAGATETEGDLDDKFAEIGKTAAEKFKVEDTWKPAGEEAVKSIKSGAESQEGALKDRVGSMMDTVIADIKGKDWTGTGSAINADIGSGISGNSNIANAAKAQAEAAKGAFTGLSWSSVGSAIVSGIAAGISATSGVLYSRMQTLAQNALAAAKKALGIASPSKTMRDQVGKWIPEGIAEGIRQGEGSVTDAMRELTDSLSGDEVTRTMVAQGRSIGEVADSAAALTDDNSGLISRIATAVREGLSEADLALYMDSRKVGSSVSKYLGNEITARRYATV